MSLICLFIVVHVCKHRVYVQRSVFFMRVSSCRVRKCLIHADDARKNVHWGSLQYSPDPVRGNGSTALRKGKKGVVSGGDNTENGCMGTAE